MVRRIALLVTLCLLVVACSSEGSTDGPVLRSPSQLFGPTEGMAAEVTGVITIDETTDCLLMESEGGARYPIVWPAGTRWQEDPPAVVLEGGENVDPGMTVYGGGGYLYREHVEELAGTAVAEAAGRCVGPTGEIAFFNIESEVDVIG